MMGSRHHCRHTGCTHAARGEGVWRITVQRIAVSRYLPAAQLVQTDAPVAVAI
jgi:hypothetical protein